MNLENLLIYLRNDSGSNITFGSTVIVPAESELIWDSVNFTTEPFNAFNNVLNNINIFNQNIFQNNLVMVNGSTDLTAQEAFDLFAELRDGYTNYNSELFTLYDKSNFEVIQFGQTVLENGIEVGSRPRINFIEGSGASISVIDDPVNNEIDVSISAEIPPLDGYVTDSELTSVLTEYVQTSRTITAGTGLSGGGNLTQDRTITLQQGLLDGYIKGNSIDGYATISTVTSLTNNLQAQINFVEDTIDGYALSSRQIIAGTGLSGGGNLTANRTISLQQGLLDGYIKGSAIDGYATTAYVNSQDNNLQAQINFVEDTLDGYIEGITVRLNTGSNIGTQPRINFIEGSGVNINVVNDSGNAELDITISSSGGGGSGNVIGPNSSTDNAIALFDGYDGYIIKNSFARISETGVLTLDVQEATAPIILSEDSKGFLVEGLNSELLSGQDGSFYTNASNLNSGTLNPARFDDTSHGNRSGGSLHANATVSSSGFMSSNDKSKLDAINLDGYATDAEVAASLSGYVPNSRTITSGAGLSGGGDLSTNRTISLQQGLLDGYARNSSLDGYILGVTVRENSGANIGIQPRINFIEGSNINLTIANDPANSEIDVTISATGGGGGGGSTDGYVYETRQILAGVGLSGGGDLSEDRTISIQQGLLDGYIDGITVRRNSGSNIGVRPRINFIEGSNVSIDISDDVGNDEIDITINASGGGGGGGDGPSEDGSVTRRYDFTWTGSSILIPVDIAAEFGFTDGNFHVEARHILQEDGYGAIYWFQGLTSLRYDGSSSLESRPNFFPSSASWSSLGPTDGMLMDVIGATTVRFTVGVDSGFPTPASGQLYVKLIPINPDMDIPTGGGGGSGDVIGPTSALDNAIARFNGITGKLIQDSSASISDDGLFKFSHAGYNAWPIINPDIDGYIEALFDGYQGMTGILEDGYVTYVNLHTPQAPGAFKLILKQDSIGGSTVVWSTEGPENIYAPSGDITIATGSNEITLIGLIWDGDAWYVVSSSPMTAIT